MEIRERLDHASGILMSIEERADLESISNLVREFHTIKGAASMMGFQRVAQLAHKLEDYASAAKSAGGVLTPDQVNSMLRDIDELGSLLHDGARDRGLLGLGDPDPSQDDLRDRDGHSTENGWGSQSGRGTQRDRGHQGGQECPDGLISDEPPGFLSYQGAQGSPDRQGVDSQSVRISIARLHEVADRASQILSLRGMVDELSADLRECCNLVADQLETWQQVQEQLEYLERLHAGRPGGSIDSLLGVSVGFSRLKLTLERVLHRYDDLADRVLSAVGDIYSEAVSLELVSVSTIGICLHRAVRDIAERQGKRIDFRFEGTDTRISRPMLNQLTESLLHLVRNAADHGVEDPKTRVAAGKPETAIVSLRTVAEGEHIRFTLEDDGRGFDLPAIERRARTMGILRESAGTLSRARLESLAFTDGLTTKETVDEVSGRGVGLGIVKAKITSIGGTIELQSVPGEGTRFTILIPSSAFLVSSLICEIGDHLVCIPISCVKSVTRGDEAQWLNYEARQLVRLEGIAYPLLAVHGLSGARRNPHDQCDLVLISVLERAVVLAVDRVVDEAEILVRPLGALFRGVSAFSGATLLSEGRIGLVFSMSALTGTADTSPIEGLTEWGRGWDARQEMRGSEPRRVLVVDDSLTSRELLRSVLESEGLETIGATDGVDALEKLRSSQIDLVVTDIEMPGMDGFTLCRQIRQGDRRYRELPIVVVTTRDRAEDRRTGLEVGANAYVVKKAFDQLGLLETIDRLLPRGDGAR